MTSFLDIIILLFIVLFIFNKLRNTLGTQPNNQELKKANQAAQKILEKIIQEVPQEKFNENLSNTDKALLNIPNFDQTTFIKNTKRVFEIVLNSYANNKIDTIKPLVNKALFEKFENAIKEKQAKKQQTFAELISFKNAKISDVKLLKTVAKIQVEFETEQMNTTKDKDGNTINGDEKFIQTIKDFWTFEKPLSSKSPIWLLASTKK